MIGPELLSFTAAFIAHWETFWSRPYRCPAGFPSIGFGARHYPDGRPVEMRDPPITEAEAEAFLAGELKQLARALDAALTQEPTTGQAAAMLSLGYNIGMRAFAGSTLLRLFNRGDTAGAADQFLLWDKAHVDGALTPLPGLARRRAAERTLFLNFGTDTTT